MGHYNQICLFLAFFVCNNYFNCIKKRRVRKIVCRRISNQKSKKKFVDTKLNMLNNSKCKKGKTSQEQKRLI